VKWVDRMNVSILIPSLETGGAESMASQLAKELNKEKFNLEFICLGNKNGTKFEEDLLDSNVKITFLNKGRGLSLSTFFKVWKILSKKKINIVHTHIGACFYVFPWVFFHKVPLVHTIHSTPSMELPYLHRTLMKIFYKLKKAVPVAISDTIKSQTSKLYDINDHLIPVIYNPVNNKRFMLDSNKTGSNNVIFTCVARLTEPKNHRMLLNAFAKVIQTMNNTELWLAGDGELKESLMSEANHLNISGKVKFLGNANNIPEILNQSDIFVLSSIYEGLPMTILEAMAAGKPVIATRVGGVPEIVKENGVLVNSGDINGLADAMLRLGTDPVLREGMGKIGLKMSKDYDITKVTRQYEALYKKVLEKNK
jgi:glycosyltransferase involved in cell wall biosynthesis